MHATKTVSFPFFQQLAVELGLPKDKFFRGMRAVGEGKFFFLQ